MSSNTSYFPQVAPLVVSAALGFASILPVRAQSFPLGPNVDAQPRTAITARAVEPKRKPVSNLGSAQPRLIAYNTNQESAAPLVASRYTPTLAKRIDVNNNVVESSNFQHLEETAIAAQPALVEEPPAELSAPPETTNATAGNAGMIPTAGAGDPAQQSNGSANSVGTTTGVGTAAQQTNGTASSVGTIADAGSSVQQTNGSANSVGITNAINSYVPQTTATMSNTGTAGGSNELTAHFTAGDANTNPALVDEQPHAEGSPSTQAVPDGFKDQIETFSIAQSSPTDTMTQSEGQQVELTPVSLPRRTPSFNKFEEMKTSALYRLPAHMFFSAVVDNSIRLETNVFQNTGSTLPVLAPGAANKRRSDFIYRPLVNTTLGWALTRSTRVNAEYFFFRDQYSSYNRNITSVFFPDPRFGFSTNVPVAAVPGGSFASFGFVPAFGANPRTSLIFPVFPIAPGTAPAKFTRLADLSRNFHSFGFNLSQDLMQNRLARHGTTLTASFWGGVLWVDPDQFHDIFFNDLRPYMTATQRVGPGILYGQVLGQLRYRRMLSNFQEGDQFYSVGYTWRRGRWIFLLDNTLDDNFGRKGPNPGTLRNGNNNQVIILTQEVARRLPFRIATDVYARTQEIFNMGAASSPGFAGYNFRLFGGIRTSIAKPPIYPPKLKMAGK